MAKNLDSMLGSATSDPEADERMAEYLDRGVPLNETMQRLSMRNSTNTPEQKAWLTTQFDLLDERISTYPAERQVGIRQDIQDALIKHDVMRNFDANMELIGDKIPSEIPLVGDMLMKGIMDAIGLGEDTEKAEEQTWQ